ncbi:MAG: DUF58 domain-containing protein [Eubacterium sp.]
MGSVIFVAGVTMVILVIWSNIISLAFGKNWKKDFKVELSFSKEQAAEGEMLYLFETIVNNKKQALPAVSVKFKTSRFLKFADETGGSVSDYYYRNDVLSVQGYEKVRRSCRFVCMRRGEYEINEAELVVQDPFLLRQYVEKSEISTKLIVYPSFVSAQRLLPVFNRSIGEMMTKRPVFEDPFEYVGVREYMPGDSMNRIHWKVSAKQGKWQVKTSAYKAGSPVTILVNLESPGVFVNETAMEESIRLAYSLIWLFEERGIATTLVANGQEWCRLEGIGRKHLGEVRNMLATISYKKNSKKGDAMLAREWETGDDASYLFFISAAAKEEIQEQMEKIRRQGRDMTWILPIAGGEDESQKIHSAIRKDCVLWKC